MPFTKFKTCNYSKNENTYLFRGFHFQARIRKNDESFASQDEN